MAYDFSKLKKQIKETEEWLARELSGVRTGRATPTLLDGIKVDMYGARTPLNQAGSISMEDARTLRITPWDVTLIKEIEKGITDANLGVGVGSDDQGLRITFPELTSERRVQLIKVAGDKTEQAKVTLRSYRTDALKEIDATEDEGGVGKDEVKRLKEEVQKFIDEGNNSLVAFLKKKETEISQ